MQPESQHVSDLVQFPEMTHNPGSIGYIEKMIIGQLIIISQPKLIIETGTFKGQTTRFMADLIRMNQLPGCKIATFDLPEVLQNLSESDSYFKNNPEIELIQGSLPGSLKGFLNKISQPVDFAIVDAQHSYTAVLEELKIIHSRLKPGSYVFCHDYRENDPKYEGIVYAADKFASIHGYNILQLNNSSLNEREVVWGAALLRKPAKKRSFLKFFYYNLQTAGTAFVSKLKK